jgi:hypothetical protein
MKERSMNEREVFNPNEGEPGSAITPADIASEIDLTVFEEVGGARHPTDDAESEADDPDDSADAATESADAKDIVDSVDRDDPSGRNMDPPEVERDGRAEPAYTEESTRTREHG